MVIVGELRKEGGEGSEDGDVEGGVPESVAEAYPDGGREVSPIDLFCSDSPWRRLRARARARGAKPSPTISSCQAWTVVAGAFFGLMTVFGMM